jgi:hypothetical protein
MQKQLQIDYRTPQVFPRILFLVFLLFSLSLVWLSLHWLVWILLQLAGVLLLLRNLRLTTQGKITALLFRGDLWLGERDGELFPLQLCGKPFLSPCLVAAVWRCQESGVRYPLFFTRSNTGDDGFRTLCRLLRGG